MNVPMTIWGGGWPLKALVDKFENTKITSVKSKSSQLHLHFQDLICEGHETKKEEIIFKFLINLTM